MGGKKVNDLSQILGLSRDEFTALIDFLKNHKKNDHNSISDNSLNKLFGDVKGGLAGMIMRSSDKKEKFFAIYASNKPILRSHVNSDFDIDQTFYENFGHIIMIVMGITSDEVPSVTHFGINRNITNFLQKKYSFGGISMILHGFAAAVWLSHFDGKKYMVTQPLASMASVFKRHLSGSDIFEGAYPTDLAAIKDAGKKVNFSWLTVGSTTTTIMLKPMADIYKKHAYLN